MRIKRKVNKRSWWSYRFAWTPTRALFNDKPVWVWFESYTRYFNYGAPVNYVGSKVTQ